MIPGFFISLVVGIIIMSNPRNRRRYPLNFIGYICLTQAANAQIILFQTISNNDFCTTIFRSLLENTLVNRGSRTSSWLGFHLTDFTLLEVAGILDVCFVVMFIFSIVSEMLFTICLNIDMIYTLINPFNRTQVLAKLSTFLKTAFTLSVVMQAFSIVTFLGLAEKVTFRLENIDEANEMLKHNGSIHLTLNMISASSFYIILMLISNTVSIGSFVVVFSHFCKQSHQVSNREFSKSLFRKQVLFYFFLFLFDMSNLLGLILQMFKDGPFIRKKTTDSEYATGVLYLTYCSRTIVLPLIRVLESSLMAEIKFRVRKVSLRMS